MMQAGPSDAFLQWWFEPWRYGGGALPAVCDSVLGRRAIYRQWCDGSDVIAGLPAHPVWDWQAALCYEAPQLMRAAELFAGLLAARSHRNDELARLDPELRRWCLAVALTQPLADWCVMPPSSAAADANTVAWRGLAELALRLERVFPGMWSRLRLLLPSDARQGVAAAMAAGARAALTPRERDRRCWLMCLAHAGRGRP